MQHPHKGGRTAFDNQSEPIVPGADPIIIALCFEFFKVGYLVSVFSFINLTDDTFDFGGQFSVIGSFF